ncbi:hypothetical protein ABBQ38_003585 [Trebouxia sp. C0009 RCD-2024]
MVVATMASVQVVFGWYQFSEQLLPGQAAKEGVAPPDILQDLGQAALQGSPCPLASTPDCPALPTLENAAAALGLLATACLPLHSRWRIEAHLGLTQRLLQQMQSQEEESGSMIVDCLTAPRDRLLSMLAPAQASPPISPPVTGPPSRPPLQQTGNKLTSKSAQAGGPASGCMSLSELSVSDPGMKEPQAWWSQVQTALLEGIQQGRVQWRALPLILQRTVMVAMKALSQEGTTPFAPTPQGLCQSAHTPRSVAAHLKTTGHTPVVSMSATCQASTAALVRQAQQQLPPLAQGLHPQHLQDFLCSMHTCTQAPCDSRDRGSGRIVEVQDCFVSIVWLIMRGEPVTQEFLTAVTASQVCSCTQANNSRTMDEQLHRRHCSGLH